MLAPGGAEMLPPGGAKVLAPGGAKMLAAPGGWFSCFPVSLLQSAWNSGALALIRRS